MGLIKNVLVTGANGFLGSHLLNSLIQNGYNVIAYLRPQSDTKRIDHLAGKWSSFIAHTNSDNEINSLFGEKQIDAIVHTAVDYGRKKPLSAIIETNVLFPLRLIEIGIEHGIELFINTDTFFGKKQFNLKHLNNYTTSKRILERILESLSTTIKIINLRLEHVYGENDAESKFVTSVLNQIIANKPEILLTEGAQKRDFVYIADVVDAYMCILKQNGLNNGYTLFEVGTGKSISVKEFVSKIAEVANTGSMLKFGAIPTYSGEILDSFANIAPLKKIGWQPKYSIEEAIQNIIKTEKALKK
jgi:nucleoside-diphosphate-sugar epimerase